MVNKVAGITLEADSRQIKSASAELRDMASAAGQAEKSADQLTAVIEAALNRISAQERATAELNATLHNTNSSLRDVSRGMQAHVDALSAIGRGSEKASDSTQEVQEHLEDLENQVEKTERAATSLGTVLGRVVAAVTVGAIAHTIIRNTIETEQATAQLNATLRATGRYSLETSTALQEYASSLQDVTTFGDEAILSAEAVLLQFDRLGSEIFPRAVESALDMSVAMNQDLRTSAVAVGKALQDPEKGLDGLTRAGISFTNAQKEQAKELVKNGQLLEAQKFLLGEVEGRMGGSARAARDTLGGALRGLQNTISDLLEGKQGGDGVRGLTDAVNELSDALNDPDVQRGFESLTRGTLTFAKWVALAAKGVTDFGEGVAEFLHGTDPGDLEGRAERLLDLEDQLAAAREKSINIFGRENRLWVARAKSLEEQIRLEREALTIDVQDFGLARQRSGRNGVLPGLDTPDQLDEIVVTAEKREAELIAIMGRIRRAIREAGEEAAGDLRTTLADLNAEIGGESVAAGNRLGQTFVELAAIERDLARANMLTAETEGQLAAARASAIKVYEEAISAEERLEQARLQELRSSVIADLEFELELMKLSNKEKEVAIALRYAEADAMSLEGQIIRRLIELRQQEQEEIEILDEVRRSATDELADFLGGFESAGDALDDFLTRMRRVASQILAEKLIQKILGDFGSGDLGSGGGFGNFLSSLFGSGRALGGPVFPGRIHPVTEKGEPELLTIGQRQFLLTGSQQGMVQPISNVSTTHRNTNVNVTITRPVSRETGVQIANEISRTQRRAEARNR